MLQTDLFYRFFLLQTIERQIFVCPYFEPKKQTAAARRHGTFAAARGLGQYLGIEKGGGRSMPLGFLASKLFILKGLLKKLTDLLSRINRIATLLWLRCQT
jgi:hypothetical protein